ncbi:MAG: amino acid adenylation domain-containing protein [Ferruginibacter sp.]
MQPSIQVQQRPDRIPLSFSQERLWFIDSMEGSLHYHIPAVIRLTGKLNVNALEGSIQSIIERHEVLRTIFLEEEGQAYQQVKLSDEWTLEIEDGSHLEFETNRLQKYIQQLLSKPYDLSKDYMLRSNLIVLGPEEYLLAVSMHHIAADGWSISILVKEIAELYKASAEGRTPQLDPMPVQYADFAIWQRAYLKGDILDKKLAYWKQKLESTAPLQIPADFPRPAVQSLRGSNAIFKIDKVLALQLNELGKQQGTTLFMTLLAAFNVLMYRYSGQQDISVGTPIAGRLQQETEGLIGFFLNTLALRSEVSENELFTTLLQQVKTTTLEAYENQEVPFEKVVDIVVKERDLSRNALFQVMLVLQNTPEAPALQLGDVTLTREGYEQTASKVDMAFYLTETPDGLNGVVQYCTDLFTPATIKKITAHFHQLLVSIVAQPVQKIGTIPMLSKAEEAQVTVEFNDTDRDYPLNKSIVTLFEEQVKKTPDATAVIFGNEQVTYQELNNKANQLAHFLRRKGVEDKSIVPIYVERSQAMVTGLLGILKAGATYVPVDPEYPVDRVTYMIEDSGAKIVVSNKASVSKLQGLSSLTVIDLDEAQDDIAKESTANTEIPINPDDLVYVIYTSGSTGKPKGVMVENRGVINLLLSMRDDVYFTPSSSFLSVTTYSFDICYLELYLPLLTGGKLIVVPREIAIDGFRLKSLLELHRPTHMQATPATWLLLLDSNWDNKEGVNMLIGGEAVKENIKDQLTKRGNVYNVYGPTETTIWSVMKKLKSDEKVLIGKPIANTGIYILGQNLQLVPVGVSGEICISGAGLARGYLNRPELTNEKFIPHPFATLAGQRLYKTGDLGRWLPDGNIECLGRIDDQVKLRGYRIELGEIETAMLQSNLVSQAVVLVKEDQESQSRLVSYYMPQWQVLKDKETALFESKLATWKEIYETAYYSRDEQIDADMEINNWKDSFTGTVISSENMQEVVDDIVENVLLEKPENVLEIGTGNGLIFNKLVDKVKQYIGVDFSQSAIEHIRQRIEKSTDAYERASFKVCAAHEIELDEDERPDTILLNSVVQYFPGGDYMTEVIGKSVSLLKDGKGRVLIGDVRDNRLLALFKSRIQVQKLQHSVSLQEFVWAVNQELIKEEELCFSPAYFLALKSVYPQITNVEIKWKQASYINELSAYRYTVILHIGVEKQVLSPDWTTLEMAGGKQGVLSQLEKSIPVLALKQVANPRLGQEKLLSRASGDKTVNTVGELLQIMQESDAETNDINEIIAVAQSKNYQYTLLMDEDPLKVNLLLQLNPVDAFIQTPAVEKSPDIKVAFTNIPLFNDISLLMQKKLRLALQKSLPDYMVPSDFIALYQLPLTNNGKVDRKFLSQRHDRALSNKFNYQPPETEIEIKLATIWQNLLGVERVGIYDNFFELGGHSLLAMRVISSIRNEFEVELVIKDLFQFTTIRELSKYLEVQLNIYSEDQDSSEYESLFI